MASISFDKGTGWWSVRYSAGPDRIRLKKTLCKHPSPWSKSKPPRKPPPEVRQLALPFLEVERQARLGQVVIDRDTELGPFLRSYIASYAAKRRPNSLAVLKYAVASFLEVCASRKVRMLRGVTPSVCAAWIERRLAEGIMASTVRTDRAYLSRIWAQARERREIAENPWEFVRVDKAKGTPAPKHWTVDELVRLIGVLEGWLRDWVILDANTGPRVTALLGLSWADVDLEANTLTIPPALDKAGKGHSIPLTPPARAVLERRKTECPGGKGPIFANPRHGRPYSRGTVYNRIGAAVAQAGIRDFGHYCHAIRHSFAVALVDADVSIRVIQALLGHASIRTTEIYARLAAGKAENVMGSFRIDPPEPPPPDES